MRILITTDMWPPTIGGTATHVPFVADALAQRGHSVRVLVGTRGPAATPDVGDAAYTIEPVDVRHVGWRATLRLFSLLRWAQVVYDNGLLGLLGDANWWMRRRVVARVTGDGLWEYASEQGWTTDGFDTFQRRHYGRATVVPRALGGGARSTWTGSTTSTG